MAKCSAVCVIFILLCVSSTFTPSARMALQDVFSTAKSQTADPHRVPAQPLKIQNQPSILKFNVNVRPPKISQGVRRENLTIFKIPFATQNLPAVYVAWK